MDQADKIENFKEIGARKIIREIPIFKSNSSNVLQFYRFPGIAKQLKPIEVKYKPTSKLTEIKFQFPPKCASALKLKNLNSENLAFRAFPADCKTYYFAKIENQIIKNEDNSEIQIQKMVLYKIQNIYLFQPFHFYYPVENTSTKLKKAESREEFEHRMKSINFKLKNVALEEYRVLQVEEGIFIPKIKQLTSDQSNDQQTNTNSNGKINFKDIEDTVKRTRIVNMKPLVEIFKNEDAVKSTLFKMTERLGGRFVLKNSYYERNIHELRKNMLDLFKNSENSTLKPENLKFLKKEIWLINEISDLVGGKYVLKGFKESFEFDSESLRKANLSLIKDLLKINRILNSSQISAQLSINEDIVCDLMQNNDCFYHLSNNSYALNDESYILNEMYGLLLNKKSFELSELTSKIKVKYEESYLLDEIKRYCTVRAGKFYLKIIKD
jgi:hypothetical protein